MWSKFQVYGFMAYRPNLVKILDPKFYGIPKYQIWSKFQVYNFTAYLPNVVKILGLQFYGISTKCGQNFRSPNLRQIFQMWSKFWVSNFTAHLPNVVKILGNQFYCLLSTNRGQKYTCMGSRNNMLRLAVNDIIMIFNQYFLGLLCTLFFVEISWLFCGKSAYFMILLVPHQNSEFWYSYVTQPRVWNKILGSTVV